MTIFDGSMTMATMATMAKPPAPRLRHFDVWRSSWHCGPNVAPRAADAAARSAHLGNEDPTKIQRRSNESNEDPEMH